MTALRWIAPFGLVLLLAHFFVLQPQLDELDEARAVQTRLKEEYLRKKRQAVNMDLLRQQLRDADKAFGELLRAVPNRIDREFGDVLRAARSRGVRIEELRPEQDEIARDFYAELGASLKVSGRFHDLGRFAADLAGAPGSLLLQDLSLDASPASGLVSMSATLRTFRYRDDEEIAAERRRARKGGKK